MASVNKVIIVGNLGKDPELRSFPSGDQVANVTIATTDRWRDKNTGENKEATEWHRVVFHGRLAEIVGQYLRKGSQIYVEGSLRTRKWTDQASGQERYATEIRADTMQMLSSRQGGEQQQGAGSDDSGYGEYEAPRQAPRQQNTPPGQRQQQRQAPAQNQQRQSPPQNQQRQNPPQGQQRNTYSEARDGRQQPPAQRAASGFDDMDDDIPFRDQLAFSGVHLVM